jgi:protein SCO1/2
MSPRALASRLVPLSLLIASSLAAQPAMPPPMAAISVEEKLGAQLPLAAKFQNTDGAEVTLGSVLSNGKPALLVLAYNRCTMLCSLVLRGVVDVLRAFEWTPGDQFSLVTISIDPGETVHEAARTQAALLDSAGLGAERERWPFLVGKKPEIDAVASQVGFNYAWDPRTEQYAHPAVIFAISPAGKVSGYFYGISPDPARLRAVLEGASEGSAPAGVTEAILNCFRLDSSSRRYGAQIERAFQGGAAVLGILVLSLIGVLLSRERRRKA